VNAEAGGYLFYIKKKNNQEPQYPPPSPLHWAGIAKWLESGEVESGRVEIKIFS
jgi:hypothetical protein